MFHVEHYRDLQVFLVFHVEHSLKPGNQRGKRCRALRVRESAHDEPAVFVVLPQLKLLGRPPAIDEDCMPGDQRGRWRSEEHDCTGDIHRFADTV